MKVHYSSKSNEWETPPKLVEEPEKEFGIFELDPCSTNFNAKGLRHLTQVEDGLLRQWHGLVLAICRLRSHRQ